ncbi:MAG: thioredoxin family protein [Weeksellaceae bacterium]|nr:thioredoxin family protein [Weeksellaceae bacterium]
MFKLFGKQKETKSKNKPVSVTDKNFNELIYDSDQHVVLDFYATWCQPCQVMLSLLGRFSREESPVDNLLLATVDVEANPALAQMFGIKSVPTVLYIHKNRVVERQPGLLPYGELREKILDFAASPNPTAPSMEMEE